MSVRLIPVNNLAAMLGIDLQVDGPADRTAIRDIRSLDTVENCIELFFRDAETEMKDGEGVRRLVKIQSQSIVDVHREKRPCRCG